MPHASLSHSSPIEKPSSSVAPHLRQSPEKVRVKSKILLIDDDPAVCEALRRVLVVEGWKVATAKNGEEALERLQNDEPDLMITDLCMDAVSGWDLLFHENLQRPGLPIFVITALPVQATGGADKIATEFFIKPLDLDALLAAVRRHLVGTDSAAGPS